MKRVAEFIGGVIVALVGIWLSLKSGTIIVEAKESLSFATFVTGLMFAMATLLILLGCGVHMALRAIDLDGMRHD